MRRGEEMNVTIARVLDLRVADVMARDTITISANATMGEAAQVFCSQNISGAPVVDEMGHCVGVLTAKDFVERVQTPHTHICRHVEDEEYAIVQRNASSPMHIEWGREDSVRQHMHQTVQTVDDQASLIDAASILCSEHIHQLIVLDHTSRPVSVVSSLDILGALVRELRN